MRTVQLREQQRLDIQSKLDGQKTQAQRNKLGQFATPTQLARDVVAHGLSLLPAKNRVRFLDPAVGTGSFLSALSATCQPSRIDSAVGFEIDPHYGVPSASLWADSGFRIELKDFTKEQPPTSDQGKATLLICNPPYVRHHHLDASEKARLQSLTISRVNAPFSGLSGLYCYFMALADAWMSDGGVAGWLVPSEFMDVNYGAVLKKYLLRSVTLLQVHRFDPNDVQFDDALVSSAVVWIKKGSPPKNHAVLFSYGGSMGNPAVTRTVSSYELENAQKWTRFPLSAPSTENVTYRLGDLFSIKRGLATGDNSFFILSEEKAQSLEIPGQFLRPILPSARHIKEDEIFSDDRGFPQLDKRLFLLDCPLPEDEIRTKYPALWAYLQSGYSTVAGGYLCRSRRFWYAQEQRDPSPIICTYMSRSDGDSRPFRFLLNHSKAVATNVFLMMYPKPMLQRALAESPDKIRSIWQFLNGISSKTLTGNGRVYGGGLHKLEPKELANVPIDALDGVIEFHNRQHSGQLSLLSSEAA